MLTFAAPARFVSIDTLVRYFSAGASAAATSLKYVGLSATIMDERLGPERIARVFQLSACRTARTDCALRKSFGGSGIAVSALISAYFLGPVCLRGYWASRSTPCLADRSEGAKASAER
jgi:hypothetical protein